MPGGGSSSASMNGLLMYLSLEKPITEQAGVGEGAGFPPGWGEIRARIQSAAPLLTCSAVPPKMWRFQKMLGLRPVAKQG